MKHLPKSISKQQLIAGYDGADNTEVIIDARFPECYVSETMQGMFNEVRLYEMGTVDAHRNPPVCTILANLDARSWNDTLERDSAEYLQYRELMDGLNEAGLHVYFLGHALGEGISHPEYVYKVERRFIERFSWIKDGDLIYNDGIQFFNRAFSNNGGVKQKSTDYILVSSGRPIWVNPYLSFSRCMKTYQQVMKYQQEHEHNV